MCSPPSPTRSRTRGHRTATAPMPVTISRSGRCPWRTSRRRPSSVNLSVWVLSQAATSASTACPNSVLAPLRKTSVSGSENVPGWVRSQPLVSVTAYPSFGGEVEALNTPTIRRLTPSCRHQLSALARSPWMPFALAELSGLATRGDHGTAGEQPPQPHLYGSDLGGIAPSDDPTFASLLSSSRPEEFHPQALPEPCMNLSIHTAPDVRPLP